MGFKSLLNKDFVILQPGIASDSQGGHTVNYTVLGSIKGRLSRNSGGENETADNQKWEARYRFYTAGDSTIGNQIERNFLIGLGSLVVEVDGAMNPSQKSHHLEIDCHAFQADGNNLDVLVSGGLTAGQSITLVDNNYVVS